MFKIWINRTSELADVAAYLSDDIARYNRLDELLEKIGQMQQVDTVIVVSKDTAWRDLLLCME